MSATKIAPRPSVICAGILVADIFVPPLPRLPSAGELCATGDFLIDSGGCAANTAACLAKLGIQAIVAGKVGNDLFGDLIAADLHDKGVDTAGLKRSASYGTSKTVILPVVREDRRFIHTFGANIDFGIRDIAPALLSQARVLYLGGYLVLPGVDPAQFAALLRSAREKNVCTVLDVVVPSESTTHAMHDLIDVLPFVDFFLPNAEEAQILTGEQDPHRQAERFLETGCRNALITQGEHGTLWMNARETLQAPSYPVETIDGSGAGDAFAAGLIAGVMEGWPMEEVLRFASAIGASACTQLGCTTGVFTRSQARAFLQSHSLDIRVLTRPAGQDGS